jgi:hypothetical protein
MQQPTVGRIVHYQLSKWDADAINGRRADAGAFTRKLGATAVESGEHGRTGHVMHAGNAVSEGDTCAAVVVRVFGESGANLQVLLDGSDTYWATSRAEGDTPGTWAWPPRA